MSETIIRPALQSDLTEIVRMIRELHIHVGTSEPPNVSAQVLQSDGPFGQGNFAIVVAEQQRALIGMCLYTFSFSGWRGRSGIFVEDLYVDPKQRGSGIGRQLLMSALEQEAERGAAFIKLEVTVTNTSAVEFYRRCGFDLSDTEAIMAYDKA